MSDPVESSVESTTNEMINVPEERHDQAAEDLKKTMDSLGQTLAGMAVGSSSGPSSSFLAQSGSSSAAEGDRQQADWGTYADSSKNSAPGNAGNAFGGAGDSNIELFLTQSPSRTLGEDVFKLSSHGNLASLEQEADFYGASGVSGSSSVRKEGTRASSRNSPIGTGTTTSSRSSSPFAANSNEGTINGQRHGIIPAFSQQQVQQPTLLHGHGSSANLSESNSSRFNNISGVPSRSSSFTEAATPAIPAPQPAPANGNTPAAGNGAQVLYMAVPSPDGRGQVLQPVQMVQMPGGGQVLQPVVMSGSGPVPAASTLPLESSGMLQNSGQPQQPVRYPRSGEEGSGLDMYAPAGGRGRDVYPHHSSGGNQNNYEPSMSNLYSLPHRPSLDDLLGQVRRLSRDQVGCRLVQQALDEEGPMAATLILNEGLPFWGEAMVDPFGNYLFQKILEKVTPEERIMLIKTVSPRLVNASLNLHGTRSVQKVVELCAQDEQDKSTTQKPSAADILTQALAPAAARLCIDSHGNHVIQRILLKLGSTHRQFVFDAVASSVGDIARHRHGCCVIQRCLDTSPTSDLRRRLVHCIIGKALELMQDAYGNYVVQYVLDVCSAEDVEAVCQAVVGRVQLLAIQKFSSNVMEKCLERCSDGVKEAYLDEISDPGRIRELMMDPFGNYVVQRALAVASHSQAIQLVEAMRPHLTASPPSGINGTVGGVRNTAGGRRIIAKICRRFPNFTLSPSDPVQGTEQYRSSGGGGHYAGNHGRSSYGQNRSEYSHRNYGGFNGGNGGYQGGGRASNTYDRGYNGAAGGYQSSLGAEPQHQFGGFYGSGALGGYEAGAAGFPPPIQQGSQQHQPSSSSFYSGTYDQFLGNGYNM